MPAPWCEVLPVCLVRLRRHGRPPAFQGAPAGSVV